MTADARKRVSLWLRNVKTADFTSTLPGTFAILFDSVFGVRHLTWYCFIRSSIASFSAFSVLFFIWAVLRPSQLIAFLETLISSEGRWLIPFGLFMPLVLVNLIPDYLSLLETRILIGWMGRGSTASRIFIGLLLDLLATGLIAFVAIVIYLGLQRTYVVPDADYALWSSIKQVVSDFPNMGLILSASEGKMSAGLFFYSTFMTSVWLWFYVVGSLAAKAATHFDLGIVGLRSILDIETKPLRSVGFILMIIIIIVTLVVLMWMGLSLLWR